MSQQAAPLYSTDAEMSVLGAVLVDQGAAAKATAALQPSSFYVQAHQTIMAAVQHLMANGDPVDLITVSTLLRNEGRLDGVGGAAYLAELANSVHTLANVEHHCGIIVEKARLRRIERKSLALSEAINHGDDPAARINELRAEIDDADPSNTGLRIWPAEEIIDAPDVPFQIEGYLPTGGFSVLYGPPGSGKTFMALKLALCVAKGFEFLGRKATKGPVLYIAAEGSGGLSQRLRAWKAYESEDLVDNLHIIRESVDLRDVQAVTRLITAARTIHGLAMVVFDTFALSIPGGDENSAKDVGEAIAQIKRIQRETGAAVMVVHHSTKASPTTERGSGALRGAADTILSLTPAIEGNVKTLQCEKQKDGDPFGASTWALEKVGSSCVIVPSSVEAEEGDEAPQKRKREITPTQRRILDALDRHSQDGLTKAEVARVTGFELDTVKKLIDRMYERGMLACDSTGKRWAKRGAKLENNSGGQNQLSPNCPPVPQPQNDNGTVSENQLSPSPGELCSIPVTATVTQGDSSYCPPYCPPVPRQEGGGDGTPFPLPPKGGGKSVPPALAPAAATGSPTFTEGEDL